MRNIFQTMSHPRHDEKMIKSDNDNNETLRRMYAIKTIEGWNNYVAYWNARRSLWICINNEKECITADGPYKMSLRSAQEKAICMAAIDDIIYGGKHKYQIWKNHNWYKLHCGRCVECSISHGDPILPKPNAQPPASMQQPNYSPFF